MNNETDINVRLVDCVGYMVNGATGHMEEDEPRMVKTPWFDKEIPFNMAAEIGTKKVITDHSTVGIVVTTDGTVTDLPRSAYVDAEERVALLDGRRVELTAQEYALLNALMEKPDVPVSREQLLRTAWGYQSIGETRTGDVHIQRLRKKLGCEYIETVYKCGYRLRLA